MPHSNEKFEGRIPKKTKKKKTKTVPTISLSKLISGKMRWNKIVTKKSKEPKLYDIACLEFILLCHG